MPSKSHITFKKQIYKSQFLQEYKLYHKNSTNQKTAIKLALSTVSFRVYMGHRPWKNIKMLIKVIPFKEIVPFGCYQSKQHVYIAIEMTIKVKLK